jgi:L-cysteine/cystine lyase
MDPARLRGEFAVLDSVAYLNAGTCGPVPRAARRALDELLDIGDRDGRRLAYYERGLELRHRQREHYTRLVGAARPEDVALTTGTSEGVAKVVAGLDLGPGDEILAPEGEHPGLTGPLLGAARRGVALRTAPLAELPEHVGPRTRLVACSHVGWVTGDVAPSFADLPQDVPLLLDGAQGAGAVPVDVAALGCAFYAAAGQKWLCGPVGTGLLHVAPEWQERLVPVAAGYPAYADSERVLDDDALHRDARVLDASAVAPETTAAAVAALDVLADHGWDAVHARARDLAARFADALREHGRRVAPRGDTTLVSWEEDDPVAVRDELGRQGVAVRALPRTPYVRASVGAWNDERDLDRLLSALGASGAGSGT